MWILLEQVTDITAAQILAMDTVPVEIIPDPGDGKIIVPAFISWDFEPGTVPFSGAGSITTEYDGGDTAPFTTFVPSLNASVQKFGCAPAPANTTNDASACAGNVTASLAAPVTSGNGTLRILAKYFVHVLQP